MIQYTKISFKELLHFHDFIYSAGVLDRLVSSVKHQQCQMTSRGLLDVHLPSTGDESRERVHLDRKELQQLGRRAQLWPLMVQLAVLNHLRLTTDLLHLALSPRYYLLRDTDVMCSNLKWLSDHVANVLYFFAVTRRLRTAYVENSPDICVTASSPHQ